MAAPRRLEFLPRLELNFIIQYIERQRPARADRLRGLFSDAGDSGANNFTCFALFESIALPPARLLGHVLTQLREDGLGRRPGRLPGQHNILRGEAAEAPIRVGEEANGEYNHADNGRRAEPYARLFVIEHRLYPPLHARLAEGRRTGRAPRPPGRAAQQRLGVSGPTLGRQRARHALIAGVLRVPAEERIRRPDQRVEPMYRQYYVTYIPRQYVVTVYMRSLVRQNILRIFGG